jgi:hypothetical protein
MTQLKLDSSVTLLSNWNEGDIRQYQQSGGGATKCISVE